MGKLRVYCLKTLNKLSIYPLGNTPSAPSVKAYAEAMVDSNCARDTYIDKEQDKFFQCVNRQRANIDVSVPLATLVQTSLGLCRSPTGPGW